MSTTSKKEVMTERLSESLEDSELNSSHALHAESRDEYLHVPSILLPDFYVVEFCCLFVYFDFLTFPIFF